MSVALTHGWGEVPMLLEVEALRVDYDTHRSPQRAVEDVSLSLGRGETLGIIGESGCGKSTLALAILGLLPEAGRQTGGKVLLNGKPWLDQPANAIRRMRWTKIAYVPQSAMNALDPVRTLFGQFAVTARAHGASGDLRQRAEKLFHQVGLEPEWLDRYPHQFSGGMRQRAVIALALLFDPPFLLADEPTTGLDVLVQREVLDVLRQVQRERGLAMMLISHDLGVVSELCNRICVMYAGRFVEVGETADTLEHPLHPYTMGLRMAFPDMAEPDRAPISIPGTPPQPGRSKEECSFAARCPFVVDVCRSARPHLKRVDDRAAACHFASDAARLREESSDPARWIPGESST